MEILYNNIYNGLLEAADFKIEVSIEIPGYITALSCFSKQVSEKSPEQQFSFLSDNMYGKDGRFDQRKSSQGENTVTEVLKLGDLQEICQRVLL